MLQIKSNLETVRWVEVQNLLKEAGLFVPELEQIQKAFTHSYKICFLYEDETLIGCGRAISDGVYQAALYDIAILPKFQGRKLGKTIIEELHKHLNGMNIILYASPGKEKFYEKMGYSS